MPRQARLRWDRGGTSPEAPTSTPVGGRAVLAFWLPILWRSLEGGLTGLEPHTAVSP